MDEGHQISRSSILYGSTNDELWFDLERFYREHINEINTKLNELDDEIWGKIILMERNKRIAKAYLRTTTLVIDGSFMGFDGRTIGFNSFENPFRDQNVEDMRGKIGEGVILKMDCQGNIIAMARGTSPVFVQGAKSGRGRDRQCYSDKVLKLRGRLETLDHSNNTEKSNRERSVKVFDMKVFKAAIEEELHQPCPNRRELLYKTCIRLSLVKDDANPLKVPCWFMIINLVAMDMLNAKVPFISSSPTNLSPSFKAEKRSQSETGTMGRNGFGIQSQESEKTSKEQESKAGMYGTLSMAPKPLLPSSDQATAAAAAAATISQLLAGANPLATSLAALQQQLVASTQNNGGSGQAAVDRIAQLANTLALGLEGNKSDQTLRAGRGGQHWKSSLSSGYMSESEVGVVMREQRAKTRSGINQAINDQCRWGLTQSMDSLYEPIPINEDEEEEEMAKASRLANFSLRPQPPPFPPSRPPFPSNLPPPLPHSLDGSIEESLHRTGSSNLNGTTSSSASSSSASSARGSSGGGGRSVPKKLFPPGPSPMYGTFKPSTWSNGSTSDYESTKEIYDSSTCSSSSRSSHSAAGRSSSPSIVSETASDSLPSDFSFSSETQRPGANSNNNTSLRPSRTLDNISGQNDNARKAKHHVPLDAPICRAINGNSGNDKLYPSKPRAPLPPPKPQSHSVSNDPADKPLPPEPIYDQSASNREGSAIRHSEPTLAGRGNSAPDSTTPGESARISRLHGANGSSKSAPKLHSDSRNSPTRFGEEKKGGLGSKILARTIPRSELNGDGRGGGRDCLESGDCRQVSQGEARGHQQSSGGHSKFLSKARRLLSKPSTHHTSTVAHHHHPSDSSSLESSEYDTNPDSSSGEGELQQNSTSLKASGGGGGRPSPFRRSPPVPPVRRRRNTTQIHLRSNPGAISIIAVEDDDDTSAICGVAHDTVFAF